jgi:hypothetical protein
MKCPLKFKGKICEFPFLAVVSTDKTPIDSLLYTCITPLEGDIKVIIQFNPYLFKLRSSVLITAFLKSSTLKFTVALNSAGIRSCSV